MNKQINLILAIVALLSGCATTPVPVSQAIPVNQDRLLAFQVAPSTPHGTLVVFRDVGFIGGGCFYAFSVNGKLAVRLGVGEVATLYVPTGELLIRASRDPMGGGLCALDQNNWTQRETYFRPNEIKNFRLSIDANGKLDVQRSEDAGK